MRNVGKFAKYFGSAVTVAALAACGGGGGGGSSSVGTNSTPETPPVVTPPVALTPIPVLRSSYENKIAAGKVIGQQKLPYNWMYRGYAFADFWQTGEYSMVNMSIKYDASKPISEMQRGIITFFKKVNGEWVDDTASILSDRTGCFHVSKVMVVDINNDKKPDVFFACTGYDAAPFPGEQQRILISKSDGTYENKVVPFTAYSHGGSAVDFNGNGYADIVLTDTSNRKQPFYLKNNKDGNFTEVTGMIPTDAANKAIFSAEIVDIDGDSKYDLWFAGSYATPYPQFDFAPSFYINSGTNSYATAQRLTYNLSIYNSVALDLIVKNGNFYTMSVSGDYNSTYIDKFVPQTNNLSNIYSHFGPYAQNVGNGKMGWFGFMHLTIDNKLVSPEVEIGVVVPLQ